MAANNLPDNDEDILDRPVHFRKYAVVPRSRVGEQGEIPDAARDGDGDGSEKPDKEEYCLVPLPIERGPTTWEGRNFPTLVPDPRPYPMIHRVRGLCLIVNNQEFDSEDLGFRHGSAKDAQDLENCFKNLSFVVKTITDGVKREIRDKIENEMEAFPHKDADAVCLCILTHGDYDGELWAKDHLYSLDTILPFFNIPDLAGKPKLIFIQACRGGKFDEGVTVEIQKGRWHPSYESYESSPPTTPTGKTDDIPIYNTDSAQDTSDKWQSYHGTSRPDFLIAYSTVPRYLSWRDPEKGSWFMQGLIDVLSEERDLLLHLKAVTHSLAFYRASDDTKGENTEGKKPEGDKTEGENTKNMKQVPCIHSTLTRTVYLPVNMTDEKELLEHEQSHRSWHISMHGYRSHPQEEIDNQNNFVSFVTSADPTNQPDDSQEVTPLPEPAVKRLKQDVDDEDYSWRNQRENKRHGRCLIINNQVFDKKTGLANRDGFEKDVQDLKECFDALSFETEVLTDPTLTEICLKVMDEAKNAKEDDEAFCLCILTHGRSGGRLWARDGHYRLEDVLKHFQGDKCPALVSKPKLFFVHACACDQSDQKANVPSGRLAASRGQDETDGPVTYHIPAMADFLVAYSTASGYTQFGDTLKGSWFVQSLVNALTFRSESNALICILANVCQLVAQLDPKEAIYKRVPCITSTLTRDIMMPAIDDSKRRHLITEQVQ